jgi:hypothetical protein
MLRDNPSLLNFSPRLGFSWSPGNRQNTLVSGGVGIYYDPLLEYAIDLQKNSYPFFRRVLRPSFDATATFPSALDAAAGFSSNVPIPFLVEVLDYNHMQSPMVLRYNLGMQHVLPGGWRTQIFYVGSRGNHLYRGYEANQYPVPLTLNNGRICFPGDIAKAGSNPPASSCPLVPSSRAGAINPNFAALRVTSADAQSFYNALQLTANKTLSRGLTLQTSYTFSKSVDDISSFSSGDSQLPNRQYSLDRSIDRGLSDFDTRHRFSANYLYSLPFGKGQRWLPSGPLAVVFGDWRLGGILSMRTGTPFQPRSNVRHNAYLYTANRPNLLPGRSNNPVEGSTAGCTLGGTSIPAGKLGGPDRYYDPCAFAVPELGTLGNVGRNTMSGPGVISMDVSLQKDFVLGGERRLQFRAESFNLLNRNNFGAPSAASGVVFTGGPPGRLNANAGRSVRILTNARQVQFALRLSF